ncbi:transmembrane protein 131-like isoform X7 [Rhineura floridana]|uniref:transmembrane protein 131-like isoform X7 n=1 Tax=Rhineura floridana TaxID=261503 RepID=UPI002AC82443|nr:transmembrane protein 131-like isoform X7 [Rhineura floridana]
MEASLFLPQGLNKTKPDRLRTALTEKGPLAKGRLSTSSQRLLGIDPVPNVVELWQAEEGELLMPAQAESDEDVEEHPQEQSFSAKMLNGRVLQFHPSVLHFGMQLLGLPKAKMLYAYNPSKDKDVIVNSVFTATRHFHVSPVHSRVIPAMGKIYFRVLFLPLEEGSFESSLFINTSSHGVFSYQVFGTGTSRATSENSRKQLANTYLLLPHINSIQISQTLAETGNVSHLKVHLECSLHNKLYQHFKSCCFASSSLMLLEISLMVRTENMQHEFVDLRQYLLENLSVVYVATDKTQTSDNSPVILYVLHSGSNLLYVQDVKHLSQDETFSVLFEPILLPSSTTNFTKVASIICKGTLCGHGSNHVVNERMNLLGSTALPKACHSYPVMEGYVGIDPFATVFYIEPHRRISASWSIWFTNNFDFSIVLTDVYVSRETKDILKVLNFTDPLTLPPGCWNVFSLKLHIKESVTSLFSNVFVATNVGVIFELPLQIYSALSQKGDFLRFEAIAHRDLYCSLRMSDTANLLWERSLSLDSSTWNVDSDLAYQLHEKWQKIKHSEICRRNLGEIIQASHQKDLKESFALSLPHLVSELGLTLNFSAAAPMNSMVKYFTLRNPSSFPVMLQLLPLSFYPDPQAPLSLLSKWFGANVQSINFTTTEFKLTEEYAHRDELQEGHDYIRSSSEMLYLKLQPLETKRIGVVFTPIDYKRVNSLILVRNNLTVLDVVYVEGIGARELLKVGGRLPGPGGSLRFKVPESTLMDCRRQLKDGKQILSITKNFKVENIGHLPITITSMKINGYNCQGYGFEVLNCQDFFLAQNSSREISIVFTPDFTSSWIIRELTLVTAAGVEFHFTLNVTLPHHLLPLCADVVPGPSWEESFWRLTVLFVSLSLLGVILISFQQAQYILIEFIKTRQRPNPSSSPLPSNSSVDTISSESYKSSCKTFIDTYGSSDKGKGKGPLPVSTTTSRSQNAAKRSPATYGHSQKKHKCSVYYGKQKSNTATSSIILTTDDKQNQVVENQTSAPKEDICTARETWLSLKYANSINVNMQKNLTQPGNFLDKEDSALKNATPIKNTSSECNLKEGLRTSMFPKETNLKTSDNVAELKEPELCPLKSSKKLSESRFPKHSPQQQPEFQDVTRKNGNSQQVPLRNETENCESLKKQVNTRPSTEKMINKGAKDKSQCCGKRELFSAEQEDALRKSGPMETREGHLPNTNWNRNRTNRKNKKKHVNISVRVPEQTELKHVSSNFERPELRANVNIRNWCAQSNGETWKGDERTGLSTQREAGENISCSDFPAETPITVNLSHNICNTSRDVNGASQYPENVCPNFTDISVDPDKNKGLYPSGDLWPPQPVCLANSVNYNLENNIPCMIQENPSLHNGFIDWNASCDGQFTNAYCPVEVNEYSAFPEENMNYHNGFPCPAEVQNTAFIDHNCQSTWSTPLNLPPTWEPTNYVNSTSYLSSTRSLSPMSGLFGSIWAPQSDVYESCCPVSATAQHSTQVENQAVLCKQEYYPRFNPFRAYMNLDIWTSAANRNANFPLSRESGYCGNM